MLGFVRQETTGQEWFSGETVTLCARVGVASQWARFKEGDKGDDGRLKPGLLRCVVHRLIRIQGDVLCVVCGKGDRARFLGSGRPWFSSFSMLHRQSGPPARGHCGTKECRATFPEVLASRGIREIHQKDRKEESWQLG